MIVFNDIELHIKAMVKSDGTFLISDRRKLLKLMEKYVEENTYDESEFKKLQYLFSAYCMKGVKSEITNKANSLKEYEKDNIIFKDNIETVEYLDFYKKILLLDKKRKTALWSERNLYILNYHEESRKFLQDNNYNTVKLEQLCWSYLHKEITIDYKNNEKANVKIEQIKKLCPNYLKNIDWSKVKMDSHLCVLLAKQYHYNFNEVQINDYFNMIRPHVEKDIELRVNYFTTILSQSSLYKSNIVKWKNIKESLGKFFNVSMKGIEEYSDHLTTAQKFIYLLSEHPQIKHDSMQNKLEKKEKLIIFGKPFLNEKENEDFVKYKEQRNIQTKVKKTKI